MKGPAADELIGGALLLQAAGENLEADEAIVELSMKPLSTFKPDFVYSKIETESVFVGLLRTAGYFLLDKDEALPALSSDPPGGDEVPDFPPLPFPRIWIETRDKAGPAVLVGYEGEGDEDDLNILGVGIIEREPGKLWDVLCLSPDTPVLRADHSWAAIESLEVGDEIVAFDEFPEGKWGKRRFRRAVVTTSQRKVLPAYRIEIDGAPTTIASGDHAWLVSTPKRHVEWRRTDALSPGDRILRFAEPWNGVVDKQDAAYLAGLFDGEGCISADGRVQFSQTPGVVLERGSELLAKMGFKTSTRLGGGRSAYNVYVLGEIREAMRFLDQVPTVRWRDWSGWEGKAIMPSGPYVIPGSNYAVVQGIEAIGEQELVGIATDTRTLIANGLMSHNTPYEFAPKDGEPTGFGVIGHTITPTGFADDVDRSTWNEISEDGEAEDPAAAIIGLAITAAHLITAERVPQIELPVSRPQRKRWERELKRPRFHDGPRVYFVDLKAAGDDEKEEGYGGSREYRVRWIVRGHYYKHPNGKYEIPTKGKCYFRRAYVKGPAGAPWKGRPVYVGGEGTPVE